MNFKLLALAVQVCHAVGMDKAKKLAEEAEDRERMARILKRHQKPAKKETRRKEVSQALAQTIREATAH
ncbi:MAG TPA: hypothetical protein VFW31_16190 [Candidatus Angelobacter sp.]|nr:hypothetical protein [Candidatus Angelobacter sp.]